jgi:hypothetical protein
MPSSVHVIMWGRECRRLQMRIDWIPPRQAKDIMDIIPSPYRKRLSTYPGRWYDMTFFEVIVSGYVGRNMS